MPQTILHIAPTPFFANRGCHIRILNEVQSLQQKGIRVIVCTYGLGDDVKEVDTRRITSILGYTKTTAGFSPYRFIADLLLFFLVLKTTFTERPTLLHGHLHEGGGIGWLVSRILFWRRLPVVMDIQGSLSGELKAYGHFHNFPILLNLFYKIEQIISRLPDKILCSSAASLDFLATRCSVSPQEIILLEDAVPEMFFQTKDKDSERQRKNIPQDKDVLIYTGSLLKGKGVDILLETVEKCIAIHPQWLFIFLGYPVEWLQKEVKTRKLEENVLILGEVSYLHLAEWLAVANIAIDPKPSGSGEASGKILHYAASSLPIVCFDLPNNRKLLKSNCFYAAEISPQGLEKAIQQAMNKREQWHYISSKAKESVTVRYSINYTGDKLLKAYAHLVGDEFLNQ